MLRTRSVYSFLNSTLDISELIDLASRFDLKYLALTDVENLFGCFKFYQLVKSAGIKPIFGVETRLLSSRFLLIAENYNGLLNINKWLSLQEKSLETLAELSDNVILILLPSQTETFTKEDFSFEVISYALFEIFADNFYIGVDETKKNKLECIAPNKVVFIPNVAFLDVKDYKYLKLLNKGLEKGVSLERGLELASNDEWNKRMQEIAEKCSVEFKFYEKDRELERNKIEKLRKIAMYALQSGNFDSNQAYLDRLNEELRLIAENQLASFISSVIELVNYARLESIPVSPGRGSAASLLLLYLTNVTMVDPIKFGLRHERFFSSTGTFDIDIEVASSKREQLLTFLEKKYNKVIKLPVFKRIGIREVISKCFSTADENKIATYEEIITSIKEGSKNVKLPSNIDPSFFTTIARFTELKKGYTIHPSAVVYDDNDFLITFQMGKQIVSWFDKNALKEMKISQLDLLSSITLDRIQQQLHLIKREIHQQITIDYTEFTRKLNYNDKQVYDFLVSGKLENVFQFGDKWRWLLEKKKPQNLEQLAECVALQRPGIINVKQLKIHSSSLQNILSEVAKQTNDTIVYQEQFTMLLSKLLDISYFEAEKLRKTLKKKDEIERCLTLVCQKVKYDNEDYRAIRQIINLAGAGGKYVYNKAHAVAYAMIVYQTALLEMVLQQTGLEVDSRSIDHLLNQKPLPH